MERIKLVELRGKDSRQKTAEEVGITPQMLGAIERGDRTPSLKLAKKIADYFGVSVDEIFLNRVETKRVVKMTRHLQRR